MTLFAKVRAKITDGQQVVVVNTLWLLSEKALLMAGGLLLSILIARDLGSEEFGRYNYVLSFVMLFGPLFSLGMYNVLLRELGKRPNLAPTILTTCLIARLIAGGSISAITLGVMYWYLGNDADNHWKFATIGVLLVCHISNAFEVYERWFQHKSNNAVLVKWRVCCFAFFMVLKLYLLAVGSSFSTILLAVSAEVLIKNLGYGWLYRRYQQDGNASEAANKTAPNKSVKGQYDSQVFSDIFEQSKYLILAAFAAIVYFKIDIIMLEAMRPISEVGVYAVAAKISEVWYVLPQGLIAAMYPKLLEIAKTQPKRYEALLQRGFDWLFITAFSTSVVMLFIGPWLIELLFGAEYVLAGQILQLHIFASVFVYMRVLLSQWLVTISFAQFALFRESSGAVVNILLNLWLIPLYGVWGAAIATIVSYAVSSYVCLWFFARTRKIAWMMTKAMAFPLRIKAVLSLR